MSDILGPVVIDIAGTSLTADDEALLSSKWVGGVILFSRNYQNQRQLTALVQQVRALRPSLLLAVDHEGGRVQRFREGFTRIPSMQSLGNVFRECSEKGLELALNTGWLLASELLAVGLDISFAPVLDVDDCVSDIIGDRSFSADPAEVTELSRAFIKGMHEAGMAVTGKHFPGHGGVKEDSHLALPVDSRGLAELHAKDLMPFASQAAELDAIMPAHIVYPQVDSLPVGFSKIWLLDILRNKLGYQGVIFSDDLSMQGAVAIGGFGQRAISALHAGCTSVLVCNNRPGALQAIDALAQQFGTPEESGLHAMRARKTVDKSVLESSARWQDTRAQLLKLR